MTTLGYIRHGVTDWNDQRRAQGQVDIPLNEQGKLQAKAVAKRLAAEQWDLIFSSDLSRASETADMIALELGIPIHDYDPRLRERGYGKLEGTTVEERVKQWGTNWHSIDHGMESTELVRQRSIDFIKDITNQFKGQNILIVSHGAFISETLRYLLNDSTISGLSNTSISILKKNNEMWDCLLYNCTKHLET